MEKMNAWSFIYPGKILQSVLKVNWGDSSALWHCKAGWRGVRWGDDISCFELRGEKKSAAEGKFITMSWKIWSWRYFPLPAYSHDPHTVLRLMSGFDSWCSHQRLYLLSFFFFFFLQKKGYTVAADMKHQFLGNYLKQPVDSDALKNCKNPPHPFSDSSIARWETIVPEA